MKGAWPIARLLICAIVLQLPRLDAFAVTTVEFSIQHLSEGGFSEFTLLPVLVSNDFVGLEDRATIVSPSGFDFTADSNGSSDGAIFGEIAPYLVAMDGDWTLAFFEAGVSTPSRQYTINVDATGFTSDQLRHISFTHAEPIGSSPLFQWSVSSVSRPLGPGEQADVTLFDGTFLEVDSANVRQTSWLPAAAPFVDGSFNLSVSYLASSSALSVGTPVPIGGATPLTNFSSNVEQLDEMIGPITISSSVLSADLDADGDVDGIDFLSIQQINPGLISVWETEYGSTSSTNSIQAAVPEPQPFVLLIGGVLLLPRSRKSRVQCSRRSGYPSFSTTVENSSNPLIH